MATPARRLFKMALFIGLFFFSVRYVHTYPWPMPDDQQRILWNVSRWLGVRDPDDVYFVGFVTIQLIGTAVAYITIMRLWRWYRCSKLT